MDGTDGSAALLDRCRQDGLILPDYGEYCFAAVPRTAADVLGVDVGPTLPGDVLAGVETDVSNVLVVLIDGLGWHRFQRDGGDHRFLERLLDRARCTPLTAVLPSSTGAAITTVHTGSTPAEHGVLGWDVRLPAEDVTVEVFPHTLRDATGDPTPPVASEEVVRATPIYPELEADGVEARTIQPAETLESAYTESAIGGAKHVPYDGIEDGAASVRAELEANHGPSYTYFYTPDVDAATHDGGTDSADYHDALATVSERLSSALYDDLNPEVAAETLLLVTADHGMVDIEPGPAGYLDVTSIPDVATSLARRPSGDPVLPWGDYRGLHLKVENGDRRRAREALEAHGVTVFSREEVLERCFYGPSTPDGFESRVGDLIATHPDLKLGYPGGEKIEPYVGMHGGPTEREMVVPFAAARLSNLRGDRE